MYIVCWHIGVNVLKVCPFCGTKIPEEAIYCLNCSSVLNERQSFPAIKVKDKKKKAIAVIPRKKFMGIVAIVLSVVIIFSSCIFAIKSTRNDEPSKEKPGTTLAPVTKDNGESVTDHNGEQVFEVVEVTDTTTEKQGLLDKLFGKDEAESETKGKETSHTKHETTTKKQSLLDKLFGDDEESEKDSSTSANKAETTTKKQNSVDNPTVENEKTTNSSSSVIEPEATTNFETTTNIAENPTNSTTTTETTTNKAENSTTETTSTTTEITTSSNETYTFEYKIEDDGYVTITGYSGNASVVTIPEKIDGCCVTDISRGAIANDSKITKIIFESRKTHIDLYEAAFLNLSSLTTIDMGGGYYTIWGHFAADCPVKDLINISKYNTFYEGGLYVNSTLVYCCENPCYSEINIPEWSAGFRNGYTLKYNENIKVINAHKNIKYLPQSYNWYNEALEAINVASGNNTYISKDGVLFYKSNSSQSKFGYSIYPYSKKDATFVMPENCQLATRSSNLTTNPYLKTLYIPASSTINHSDSSWLYNTSFCNLQTIYVANGHSQYDKISKTFTGNIYTY